MPATTPEIVELAGFTKCPHVDHAKKLTHCDHCNLNFCDDCVIAHKECVLLDIVKASTGLPSAKPSTDLTSKVQHANQFLDEDLLLIKQQIGSTIDSIIERFSTYLWSQGSKILSEAEDAVASEKKQIKSTLASVDLGKVDSEIEELKERFRKYRTQKLADLSLEQLGKLAKDFSNQAHFTEDIGGRLSATHRVRVGFDVNDELEKAVQSFDNVKLGAVNVLQPGQTLQPPTLRPGTDSGTDVSYRKVTLLSVFHGKDAFGDAIYLPHAICALIDSPFVAFLHGEYRISIMPCTPTGPCCIAATYHVRHPVNAPASLPLHNIAADKNKLYIVAEAGANLIVWIRIDESSLMSPTNHTVIPRVFAKSWSGSGFRGLAVGTSTRWLYTADGDSIEAYSLDSGVPTYRRICTFPANFEPTICDVFPDGITLVYMSKPNGHTVYWRAFLVAEDVKKNGGEIVKTSRHYANLRETNFGGVSVDRNGNLILCDDRSLQIYYRYAVDIPVSTFPVPIIHDEQAPPTHVLDPCGMAVLPCGVNCNGGSPDTSTFKESCSSICALADCNAHRILMFKISG